MWPTSPLNGGRLSWPSALMPKSSKARKWPRLQTLLVVPRKEHMTAERGKQLSGFGRLMESTLEARKAVGSLSSCMACFLI